MRLLLASWFVAFTWLTSAAGLARAPEEFGRELRSAGSTTAQVAAVPPKVDAQLRAPRSITSGGASPAQCAPALHAGAPILVLLLPTGVATLPATAARHPRPRRLRFAYQATAPPSSLS